MLGLNVPGGPACVVSSVCYNFRRTLEQWGLRHEASGSEHGSEPGAWRTQQCGAPQ